MSRKTFTPRNARSVGNRIKHRPIILKKGDCFQHLRRLPNHSIDAVITDPPYGNTDCFWDYSLDLARWWKLIEPKLKPTSVVVMFACGRFTFDLYASAPRLFRYDLVWEKSRPAGFLNANRMPLRAHEMILVFANKLHLTPYNPQKVSSGKKPVTRVSVGKKSIIYHGHSRLHVYSDQGMRHPRSVLRFNSVDSHRGRGHPTQKPLDLMRWLVRTYTKPGQMVVDPFLGSGTTAAAAMLEGRRFWGCERDPEYLRFARRRIAACAEDGLGSGAQTLRRRGRSSTSNPPRLARLGARRALCSDLAA